MPAVARHLQVTALIVARAARGIRLKPGPDKTSGADGGVFEGLAVGVEIADMNSALLVGRHGRMAAPAGAAIHGSELPATTKLACELEYALVPLVVADVQLILFVDGHSEVPAGKAIGVDGL